MHAVRGVLPRLNGDVEMAQRGQRLIQVGGAHTQIDQRRQNHVATRTAHTVKPQYSFHFTLLIIAAATPAPNPLSMLTTVIPGAQLFSIASNAVIPPRLAP